MTPVGTISIVGGMETTFALTEARRSPTTPTIVGARSMLPWLVGVVPFGITIGVAVAETGVHPSIGLLGGAIVFAGTAQLAVLDGVAQGAVAAAALTALIINLRLVAYGAAMRPFWTGLSRVRRLLFAAVLIDPTMATGLDGYREHDTADGHRHYLGGAVVLMVAWLASIATGIAAGSVLPDMPILGLFVPLFLLAELSSLMREREAAIAAVVGGVVGALTIGVPLQGGIVISIAVAAFAAPRLADRGTS